MRTDLPRTHWRSSFPALAVLLATAGCDSTMVAVPDVPEWGTPDFQVLETAAPMKGTWSGVVTDAVDLNNASFGRDPADWVGRTVTGTFSIDPATPGLWDGAPASNVWLIYPDPGPGPFIEFVEVTAVIDGVAFGTDCSDMNPIFFGDVVLIEDQAGGSSFRPQDSCVGARPGGFARSVVGFDAYFAPGAVAYDGSALDITGLPQFGFGVIDELFDVPGPAQRIATISFQVTEVTLTPLGPLGGMVLQLEGSGVLSPQQAAGLRDKIEETSAKLASGHIEAACNQLRAFGNQVQAFINSGSLTVEAGQQLLAELHEVRDAVGC